MTPTPQVPAMAGMTPLGFASASDTILDPPKQRTLKAVETYVRWATQRIETVLQQAGRTVSGVKVKCIAPGRASALLLDCDGTEAQHVELVHLIRQRTGLRPQFGVHKDGFTSIALFYPIGAR